MEEDELPDDIYEQVTEHSEKGNVLLQSGDNQGAIDEWETGLKLLPEPKNKWEAAMWFYASLGEGYRNLGQTEASLSAFTSAYASADGHQNGFVLHGRGVALFDLGRTEEAAKYLLQAYILEGEMMFEEDASPAYFQLLKDKKYID